MSKIIRTRAPLRISFGGGGTDVTPYVNERGGYILNATINRFAYVTIIPNERQTITLRSLDYGDEVSYLVEDEVPPFNYQMDLAKGVIKRLGVDQLKTGFDLFTHSDCPPNSGLGASSTMVVALIGAFDRWMRLGLNRYETAQLAYDIERIDLGISGGKQDQYTAAFGGFNFMEFSKDYVLINPLRIPPEWVGELEYSLVLAYTGKSRYSADIIKGQITNYEKNEETAIAAMDQTKQIALDMKQTLLKGALFEFGHLLHDAWLLKKKMSEKITNAFIDHLYDAARAAGALGGKISGAGGGGFMFFYTDFDRRHHVVEALQQNGAEVVHFGFTETGMQTWTR